MVMKKIFLMALLLPFVLFSCQTNEAERGNGTGQIGVTGTKGIELSDPTHVTRADADVNQFTLIVEDEDAPSNVVTGLFSSFAGGVIDNLRVGSYTVTLTSHPDGFTPAFDDPMYEGVKENVPVTAGGNTLIEIEAVQANSGVYFVYDESLYTIGGFTEVVPTIAQGASSLVYEGANAEAWGYFNPSPAVLTIKDGNESLTISGEYEQTLNLTSEQLLEITLTAVSGGTNGSITIVATVKVITSPTDFEEFILGNGQVLPDNGYVAITISNITYNSALAHVVAIDTPIDWGKYGCFTTESLEEMEALGYSLEDLMEMEWNGYELSIIQLANINSTGHTWNFSLNPETRLSMIIYAEIDGVRKISREDFTTLPSNAPVKDGDYMWTWYEEFDADFTNLGSPYVQWLSVVETNVENSYELWDFFGIWLLDMVANYDAETSTLVLTGYDTNGYKYVNTPEGLYFGDYEYSAGWYVRDADMNLVDNITFNVVDRYIDTSKYHVSIDLYTYGSTGDPADFVATYEVAPMGDPIGYYGYTTAKFTQPKLDLKAIGAEKARSNGGRTVERATGFTLQ